MKRYTGQKALYEAISRSRAKAKQHSILEKLRPVLLKPQTSGGQEPQPPAEPEEVVGQTPEPVVEELPEPQVVETPPQSVLELPLDADAGAVAEVPPEPLSEMSPPPVARSEPASTLRPVERLVHTAPPAPVQTWLKPRPVQLNEGRIEVSVPYYVGAIAGIVFLMVVLVAYRLGQTGSGGEVNAAAPPAGPITSPLTRTAEPNPATSNPGRSPANPSAATTSGQGTSPVVSQGDNWIVLVQHKNREDLVPVVDHFARNGIDLFILPLDQAPAIFAEYGLDSSRLPAGGGFLLVTKKAYDNPNVPGSEGEKIVKRIAEVGALYKAQSGDKLFAPKYFSDAYGMRIRK
ncbi:MAG: hypothetical protein ABFD90_16750 [Phycisphaerales bacterium]